MRCVTQKGKYCEAMSIKGFSDRDSYTKYKIWIINEKSYNRSVI